MQELSSIFRSLRGLQELPNELVTPAAAAQVCSNTQGAPPDCNTVHRHLEHTQVTYLGTENAEWGSTVW